MRSIRPRVGGRRFVLRRPVSGRFLRPFPRKVPGGVVAGPVDIRHNLLSADGMRENFRDVPKVFRAYASRFAMIPDTLCLRVPNDEELRVLPEPEKWAWLGGDPVKTEAFRHRMAREHDRKYRAMAMALITAGWVFEMSDYCDDMMSWYWRSPPKRKGSQGRLYRSTDQAYNRLMRDAKVCLPHP